MKVATTVLIGALAAKQAVATWDLFAKPFSVPQLCENICDDNDKDGFDWNDLDDGNDVGDYRGYQFGGFKCSNKFDKRDILSKRTFQSKCITGEVSKDKISGPKISSNEKNFSIHEMEISVDVDIDVEFHYGMPDGSTCKQHVPCKKGGSKVKNTMCGGAKEVTFQIPTGGKEDKCELNFHNIDFYCNPKPSSTPPTPTPTPSPSPPSCVPGEDSPGCPESPSATPTPAPSTSVPLPSSPAETPSSPPSPSETPAVPSTPGSPEVPSSSETPEVPPPSETPEAPPSETPEVPEPSETPEVPEPSETPEAPEPSETPEAPEPSETPEAPEASETPSSPPPGDDYESSTAVLPSATPSSPPEDSTTPAPEQPGTTVIPEPSTVITPEVPVPTVDCPGEVQKCINTANELKNKCKDNTDSDCYCKDPELVKDVMECLDQWLEDNIKDDAFSFFVGICAPHIPENPAIVTECPTTITLGPTPPPAATPSSPAPAPTGEAPPSSENNPITAAPSLPVGTPGPTPPLTTITATQTVTVPCDCESPELSTYTTTITVPQVHFTTNTAPPPAGQTAGESVGLVPGTPAPVAGNPTSTGALPSGFGTTVVPTPTAALPSPSQFTGAASAFGANTVGALAGAFIAVLAL